MAQAVLRLCPGTKYAIGPTIENGFYYDFRFAEPIADADLARIEKEMAKIVAENLPVAPRLELPRAEALALLPHGLDQPFKVELIEDLAAAAGRGAPRPPSASTPRASSPTSAAGRTCPAPVGSARAPSS